MMPKLPSPEEKRATDAMNYNLARKCINNIVAIVVPSDMQAIPQERNSIRKTLWGIRDSFGPDDTNKITAILEQASALHKKLQEQQVTVDELIKHGIETHFPGHELHTTSHTRS